MAGKTTNLQLQKIDDTDYAGNFPTIYNNNLDLIDGLKEDINNAKGNVWEEVDLNNFPNDWEDGDTVKIQFKLISYTSKIPSSWNTSIERSFTPHIYSVGGTIVEGTLHNNTSNTYGDTVRAVTGINLGAYAANITYANCRTALSLWNARDFKNMVVVTVYAFNGYNSQAYSFYINNNLTEFIFKMWRLR